MGAVPPPIEANWNISPLNYPDQRKHVGGSNTGNNSISMEQGHRYHRSRLSSFKCWPRRNRRFAKIVCVAGHAHTAAIRHETHNAKTPFSLSKVCAEASVMSGVQKDGGRQGSAGRRGARSSHPSQGQSRAQQLPPVPQHIPVMIEDFDEREERRQTIDRITQFMNQQFQQGVESGMTEQQAMQASMVSFMERNRQEYLGASRDRAPPPFERNADRHAHSDGSEDEDEDDGFEVGTDDGDDEENEDDDEYEDDEGSEEEQEDTGDSHSHSHPHGPCEHCCSCGRVHHDGPPPMSAIEFSDNPIAEIYLAVQNMFLDESTCCLQSLAI